MQALDLYCGAGGASYGLSLAGYDVQGVDRIHQPHYPYRFTQCDVLDYPIPDDIDFVWASPPCQCFTAYQRTGNVGTQHKDLIESTRRKLKQWGGLWVIENVVGAPLRNTIQLCGSSFGLDVRRHRLFECNFPVKPIPCDHSWQKPRFPPASNRKNLRKTVEIGAWRIPLDVQRKAMGIDWMVLKELSQAVPPAYSKYIADFATLALQNSVLQIED